MLSEMMKNEVNMPIKPEVNTWFWQYECVSRNYYEKKMTWLSWTLTQLVFELWLYHILYLLSNLSLHLKCVVLTLLRLYLKPLQIFNWTLKHFSSTTSVFELRNFCSSLSICSNNSGSYSILSHSHFSFNQCMQVRK